MRATITCAMIDRSPSSNLASVGFEGTAVLSYGGVDSGDDPIGEPWDLDAKSNSAIGKEPWTLRCQDLPFDLAKPMRIEGAYEIGARNQHAFDYKMGKKDGVYRTSINGVSHISSIQEHISIVC